tara:strand:- start:300 stop:659 length:360 start_codon:yes stop_codon:yes gene_type:complete
MNHFLPYGLGVQTPAVDLDGRLTPDEYVVLDPVVSAAPNEGCACTPVEDVAIDYRSAGAIVKVNSIGSQAEALGVVEEIVSDFVSALSPVATHIECTDISRFLANMVNVVVLNGVFISR